MAWVGHNPIPSRSGSPFYRSVNVLWADLAGKATVPYAGIVAFLPPTVVYEVDTSAIKLGTGCAAQLRVCEGKGFDSHTRTRASSTQVDV
jgi:hypothetical protein